MVVVVVVVGWWVERVQRLGPLISGVAAAGSSCLQEAGLNVTKLAHRRGSSFDVRKSEQTNPDDDRRHIHPPER